MNSNIELVTQMQGWHSALDIVPLSLTRSNFMNPDNLALKFSKVSAAEWIKFICSSASGFCRSPVVVLIHGFG